MAKSVRITSEVKASIMKNVTEKVRQQYLDSNFGFEYESAKLAVINCMKKRHQGRYPLEDLEVLKKHKCIHYLVNDIVVEKDINGGNEVFHVYSSSSFYEKTDSLLVIEYPANMAFPISKSPANTLSSYFSDKEGQEILKEFWEIADKADCEYTAIVNGYFDRIKAATTTGSLLKKFPKMEKFMPEFPADENHKDETTEKMLELFEGE